MKKLSKSISIVLFLCLCMGSNMLFAQGETSSADTLSEADIFGASRYSLVKKLMVNVQPISNMGGMRSPQKSMRNYMLPTNNCPNKDLQFHYVLANAMEYYYNVGSNFQVNLSPEYLFLNQEKNQSDWLKACLKYAVENGTVPASVLPYGVSELTDSLISETKFVFENYLQLINDDTRAAQKLTRTIDALKKGNPVIIELHVDSSYASIDQTGLWSPQSESLTNVEYVLVVGYDKTSQLIEVKSTNGIEWGYDGYAYITFEDYVKAVTKGFVLVPVEGK